MSIGRTLLFLAIVIAVLGGGHYYLWARLVRDPGWPAPWPLVGTVAVVALGLFLPFGMIGGRFLPRDLGEWVALLAFAWMGAGFYLILLCFAGDLSRLLLEGGLALRARLGGGASPLDPERRQLVAQGIAGATLVAAGAFTAAGVRAATGEVQVKEVPVRLPRLPPALSGLTIAQLTDVHVGPTLSRRFVEALVERTRALKPDLVVITGDLVDGTVARLAEHVAPLAKLDPRFGTFFVTGNHEFYSGPEEWLAHLARLGIRTLRNERVSIGDAGASLDLAGVGDPPAGGFGAGWAYEPQKAFEGRDPERELVLLAHQPRSIDEAAKGGAGLQLSGHTHAGQMWPFGAAVRLAQPYVEGLHRHGALTQIYVSSGTGYWGPPLRGGTAAEITKLVLTP